MSDEANNPSPELALETADPAPEAVEVEDTQPVEEVSDNEADAVEVEADADAEPPAPAFVSVEYDGQEYEVPEALKDALMRQKDYTTKTQTLADQRRQVEAQAAQLQQEAEMQQLTVQDVAAVQAIDKQLEQYAALNWDELYQSDMATAVNLDRQKRDLEGSRQQAIQRLNENHSKALESRRQQHAQAIEEGQRVLQKEIDGWSPQLAQQIATYGVSQGLPESAVQNISDPVHVKLIDKARRYDELMAAQKAANPKPEPQAAVKVKGKSAPRAKDPDKMSMREWQKWRNQQLRKRSA